MASCAPKPKAVKPLELPPILIEDELVLPELPEEPEEGGEIKLPPPGAAPIIIEEGDDEKYIILNFENTDIRTIIDTFSEILGINYILTPGISGTVTIQSYNKFPLDELYAIFQSVLEINGLTAIRENSFFRIVPLDTARQQPLDIEKGREFSVRLDGSFVTQLIPLQYVNASEIANIFRNLMPRGTDLIVYEPANMLIVTALPPTLIKFMKLISSLDVQETESEAIRTFVYHVENGEAKKLADILKSMYPSEKAAPRAAPAKPTPVRRPAVPTPQITAAAEALPGVIGEITVNAYEDINALLIKCTPKTYVALLEVLDKIDVPVKQVVIEVLIAEITLTDSIDFGVQWLLKDNSVTGFTTTSEPITSFTSDSPLFASLVTGTINKSIANIFLTALATDSKVNVLANPQILAMDNKEAEIKIGNEVPTATGLTQQPATGGGATLVSSGQIQYRTVGTILTVTPRITEAGNVNMKLVVEQSGIGEAVTLGSGTFPSFTSRKATTSAVVSSGKTLFLGGLISEDKRLTRSGIPGLSKIPILGLLFGTTTDVITKRELLVMVTPHVIGSQDEAEVITQDFQNRVRTIKKRLDKLDRKGKNVFLPPKKETEEIAEETAEEVIEEETLELPEVTE
jgi:general secretion pathway protein D